LYYPVNRVQYSAARAILRIPTSQAPVASARVVEVLARFLRTGTAPKILFVFARDQRATELRNAAMEAKYQADVAPTLKDAFQLLHKTADYDAIVLDVGVPAVELPRALASLRADSESGLLPLLLVASADRKSDLTQLASNYRNTFVLPSVYATKGADLKRELEEAIKFSVAPDSVIKAPEDQQPWLKYEVRRNQGQALSEMERARFAKASLDWFAQMARGELTGYDLKPAEDAILQALNNKEDSKLALLVLARFPGSMVQQRLAGILFDADKQHLHAIAAKELNRHIQKNGLVLSKDEIGRLRALDQGITENPEVRAELAVLVGTLRATAQQTGSRLLNFRPDQ
jgi:CheY-like chemotaxis protein